MLDFELTPKHAGLILWGTPFALSELRDIVIDIVAQCPVIDDEESWLLGLAYDMRKAIGGHRRVRHLAWREDRVLNFGAEILWTELIAQVGTLRSAMSFFPSSNQQQAVLFGLESIIERAVVQAAPAAQGRVHAARRAFHVSDHDLIGDLLPSRNAYFCQPTSRTTLGAVACGIGKSDLSWPRPLVPIRPRGWSDAR